MDTRYLTELDLKHPIWHAHKHHRLDLDVVISFPPGTGGNFITTINDGADQHNVSVNAFDGHGAHNMIIDDIPWNQQIDLETLHEMISTNPPLPSPDQRVARCHNLPWLAMNIFDMSIAELIVITMETKDTWFPAALNKIKWLCNRDWNSNPDMMFQLLEDAHHTGEVRVGEYRLLCDAVLSGIGIDCSHTVISWKHYMRAKEQGIALDDISEFSKTFTGCVFQTLQDHCYGCYDSYADLWRGDIFDIHLRDLKARVGSITSIDYLCLMADMDTGDNGYLSGLDHHKLASYTRQNMDLISRWLRCCTPLVRDKGHEMLALIDSRVAKANIDV